LSSIVLVFACAGRIPISVNVCLLRCRKRPFVFAALYWWIVFS